jgi:proteasome lid subunit RPN8/RPN11
MNVVADVHTHPTIAIQSDADRRHPMIAVQGHIALIVPYFANHIFMPCEMGIYEYKGSHKWHNYSGKKADRIFYIGRWG